MKTNKLLLGFLAVFILSYYSALGQNENEIGVSEKYTGPIIDMHMHTGLFHEIPAGTPSLCRPEPCEGDTKAVASKDLLKSSLEAMDRHNISKGFLSGVDWNLLQEWKASAPDRFIASPFILDPKDPGIEKLKKEYEMDRFGGMGEIGN